MRLLIVEDEHKIATALKKGFEQETFAVDVAHAGSDAIAFATTESYDAIILDLMLPGMIGGIEVCKEVRRAGVHTPILMLTAKDKVPDRVAGLNAGADDYLVKPFAFEELLARVRALLRRPSEVTDTTLKIDDLTLDTTTYAVKRGGKSVKLSAKEFALLEYLLRNQNQIVSKETIINHVWDYDADILPNTVEVYIRYLRTKIDDPFPGPPLVHTVRGFGYKLEVGA
jgi:DNA-binding response OmpR family regulator